MRDVCAANTYRQLVYDRDVVVATLLALLATDVSTSSPVKLSA